MQGASKVGLLVVVFAVLLAASYAILGRSVFAPKTTAYYADFDDAAGVTEGAYVLMAGVKIGTVTDVKLISPSRARLSMDIVADARIPVGSHAEITSSLLGVGENPVSIVPPAQPTGAYVQPGGSIQGAKVGAFQSFLPNGNDTMAKVDEALTNINKLMVEMRENKLVAGIKNLMDTSDKTVARFGELASSTNTLIAQNRASIGGALNDARGAIADMRKAIALATKLVGDDKLKGKVTAMLDSISKTSDKAQQLIQSLNDFVNDPKLREPLRNTASNVAGITDTGTRIAVNTEQISKNGVVVSQKAIELADKANEIADEAKETLKKLQEFFKKVPSGSEFSNIQSRMDLSEAGDLHRSRADIDVLVPYKDYNIHLGVFDAFETNKLDAQLAQKFGGTNDYRYGVYAGKPGVGVDYRLVQNMYLVGDLYDLNNTRLDLRARYDFGKNFVGWLGLDDVFERNAPIIGIGFQK
jgi:phospholipid/cholesterol/gamma-HCH transport system substrate-binding protein